VGSSFAGSLLSIPVFELPFHRDIDVTPRKLELVHTLLKRCRASGGCLCVAREHRASLLLKQQVFPYLDMVMPSISDLHHPAGLKSM
jgi:hypothetical protein